MDDEDGQFRPGFNRKLLQKLGNMLRAIQDAGGRSFCCYYVREGECRDSMRCGFSHLSLDEVKALKKEYPGECEDGTDRPRVQCDNSWFDGTCYHKDLREHP